MVKMTPDKTGRFAKRLFFTEKELDSDCERLIRELNRSGFAGGSNS
jgi:hypothetical protein